MGHNTKEKSEQYAWMSIRRKLLKAELWYLAAIVLGVIITIILEYRVVCGSYRWSVKNYDEVSLVIIQIQATIQTLTIALLALASSQVTESHMGISYNDFRFNIRPVFFTQKRIITGSILLLALNIFLHMAGFYNAVVTVFLIACLLIVISVWEIYAVFMGRGIVAQEIQEYLLYRGRKDAPTIDKIEAFQCLCCGWRMKVEGQSDNEYNEYITVFRQLFRSFVLDEEPVNVRTTAQQECSKLIHALCGAPTQAVRERALSFVYECYELLWSCLSTKPEAYHDRKGSFHLIGESFDEIYELLLDCDIERIEKRFPFEDFSAYVLLCNYWLGYKSDNREETNALCDLAQCLGYCLSKQRDKRINLRFWGKLIDHLGSGSSRWPDEQREEAEESSAEVKFSYIKALIRSDLLEFVGDNFYRRGLRQSWRMISKHEIYLMLKVQACLLYLAEYESTECVSSELKQHCKDFLFDAETEKYFCLGLDRAARLEKEHASEIDGSNDYIFTETLVDSLTDDLRRFEFSFITGDAKTMVIDCVAQDLVVFSTLYLSEKYSCPEILERILSRPALFGYYMRYIESTQGKARLLSFLRMINEGANEHYADMLLIRLADALKGKIKENELLDAALQQKEYSKKTDETQLKAEIGQSIREKLEQIFKPILSADAQAEGQVRLHLFQCSDFTDDDLGKTLSSYSHMISQQSVSHLCCILKKLGAVDLVSKRDFPDDDSYLLYLHNNDDKELAIGSDHIFQTKEWKNRDKLLACLDSKTCILTGYTNQGLLLKKDSLSLWIHDVRIGIHAGQLGDFSPEYNSETGRYCFEVVSGIPIEFTPPEMKQYLHDRRKIVDVVITMSIKRGDGKIGDLLYE